MTEFRKYQVAERLALTIHPKKDKETHHPDPLAIVCLTQLLMKWKDTPWKELIKNKT